MKQLDINIINQAVANYNEQKQSNKVVLPLKFLLSCGWDKIDYDNYLSKYTLGTLDQNEFEVFSLIYTTILDSIATIESLCAFRKIDYYFYKTCMEQFAGSGLVSNKQQKTIQERIEKFKKQQEQVNNSGLEIK